MNLFKLIPFVLGGGFAAGYRTYIFGFLLILDAFAKYAVGDLGAMDLMAQLPQLAEGAGLMALRAAIKGGSG